MTSIPRFAVGQPVLVNLLMVGIILGGFFALFAMPQELEPNINFNWVFVTIIYPGASPHEVEDLITIPVEKELDKIDRVDEITSTAGEGWGFFLVKFKEMSDTRFSTALQDVRMHVDQADLPKEAEDPIIEDFGSDDFRPIISVALTFDGDQELAAVEAENLSDEIRRLTDVAKVEISGLEDREIWVEVDPIQLNAQRLTLGSVVRALASRNINLPGGNIQIGRSEFLVRAISRYTSPEDICRTVLKAGPGGRLVHLGDIAAVRMVRAEAATLSRLQGDPSITISVSKSSEGSTFSLVEQVKDLVARQEARGPAGITYTITRDSSRDISKIVRVLRNNGIFGMVFIIGILLLFLGTSNALLAAMGIPLSFLITFIFLHLAGQSINGTSLFGLIIVLGIIVDDAIIVLENVHRHRQRGIPLRQAVVEGTEEVLGPVTSGILTTIAAFIPLMLLPGIMGKFMRVVPLVVSLALLASLLEATAILPSHINDWTKRSRYHSKPERPFFLRLQERYQRLLESALRKRYLWAAGVIVLLIAAMGAIPLVGVEMFGAEDLGFFAALVKLPEGTAINETDRVLRKIEAQALQLPAEDVTHVVTNTGLLQSHEEWITRKNVGQVVVSLVDESQRQRSIDELIDLLRHKTRGISGITSLEFLKPSGGPPVGKPVSIRVTGKYLDDLRGAVADMKAALAGIPGVRDIGDDFPEGKQEIRITVDEVRAALLGLTSQEIALEVRTAIEGMAATTFRDGNEDVDVIVKLQGEAQHSLEAIRGLKLANLQGATIPLADVASITVAEGAATINHRNLDRIIRVTADIDKATTSVDRVARGVEGHFEEIGRRNHDVHLEIGGEFEEFSKAFDDILQLFAIGVVLIYLILGTQFRSYIQPLVILGTVPFAFIGAMIGLMITGDKFGIVTLFGVVALAGIVVNDSIVLITFVNNARRAGQDRWASIVTAGRQRLRPIILTSVTTIGGLLPTVLGLGGSSGVWRPLASTIAWGLVFSTILTLVVIPCFLAVVDDIKTRFGKPLINTDPA